MRRFIFVICFGYLLTFSATPAALAADTNAKSALNAVLPDIRFDSVSLNDAVEFIRDVSGANIHINWRAIEEIGIGKDTVINVRLRSVPMRKVMQLVLSEAGRGGLLTYFVDSNVIEVTTREIADRQLFTRVYPVDDLLMEIPNFDQPPQFNISAGGGRGGGGGSMFGGVGANNAGNTNTRESRAQALVDTITSIIQPDIWTGGGAAIRFWNGSLIVTAPRSVHEALAGFTD